MENRKHATGEAMNTEPILCSGDDLDSVLAGIRERGCFVASLETRVGKLNGQYRVNYFSKTETGLPFTSPPIEEAGKSPKGLGRDGNEPVMKNRMANDVPSPTGNTGGDNFERVADEPLPNEQRREEKCATHALQSPGVEKSRMGTHPKVQQPNEQDKACGRVQPILTPAEDSRIHPGVVERGSEAIPSTEHSGSPDNMLSPSVAVSSRLAELGENPGTLDSIEQRMAALQEKMVASGKLKHRQPIEARLPHND